MKSTFIDRFIGFFSPETELTRIKSRGKTELILRAYDAAKTFQTDDWSSATSGSANLETRGAQQTLRNKGSDAIRNNSYAARAIQAIVSNTVGPGILPHIKGKTKLQTKRINEAWKEWAETTLCDSTRKNNFYSMQSLIMRSVVERGEALALKEVNSDGMSLRILESDYIVSYKDSGSVAFKAEDATIQGIKTDKFGRVNSYWLYDRHPGEIITYLGQKEVPADQVCHIYRIDRPGQLRGVTWFAPVLRQLEDLNQYQQATLISRKIGACFSAFITTTGSDDTMTASELIKKRESESMLSPGSIKYLAQGESVVLATPPKIDGYTEYCNQMLRSIASGLGISYESLTSDYSLVNYSSGRMGHLEFRKNVEQWRWSILIQNFCEPVFEFFLLWCDLKKGIPTDGVTADWIPPSWSMLDPGKEIAAMTDGIRAGLMSYPKAVRELGFQPEEMLQEIADNNKSMDDLKIILDSDPRKITKAGLLQVDSSQNTKINGDTNASSDQTVPSNGTPPKSN